MRGGGEGGEAADDGRLAVDVYQPGRLVAGEQVAVTKGGQARIVLIRASPLFAASVVTFFVLFRQMIGERWSVVGDPPRFPAPVS